MVNRVKFGGRARRTAKKNRLPVQLVRLVAY